MKIYKKGFTLVELVVVVSIVAILSTVGFVAYSSYLEGVRDATRVTQLKALSDALNIYSTKVRLPLPDNNVEIKTGDRVRMVQGEIGENIISSIEYSGDAIDPKDHNYFLYNLSSDYKYFTLAAYLEEDELIYGTVNNTSANYSLRYPFVEGSKLGVFFDENNQSIHRNSTIINNGNIDLLNLGTQEFGVVVSNTETYTGTGNQLLSVLPNFDCKRINDLKGSGEDGVYRIDPNGDNIGFQVYCDMTSDGGGWTLATMLGTEKLSTVDRDNTNMFDTGDNSIITSITQDIRDKGNIDNVWTDTNNRDLLFRCVTEHTELKGYEVPFIIYDFEFSDKVNLTKLNKAGTTFSSKNLDARWKNYKYSLSTLYGSSSLDNSMYFIRNDASDSRLFLLKRNLGVGNELNTAVFDTKSPSYYQTPPSGNTEFKNITPLNYCYSAVRSFGQ